jgi:ferredoxin
LHIKIDHDKCIGCGVCVAMCDKCFALNEENGLAISISPNCENEALLSEIIETCPVMATSSTKE